jgi:hypothetical protein
VIALLRYVRLFSCQRAPDVSISGSAHLGAGHPPPLHGAYDGAGRGGAREDATPPPPQQPGPSQDGPGCVRRWSVVKDRPALLFVIPPSKESFNVRSVRTSRLVV